jgi:hypothetical protein
VRGTVWVMAEGSASALWMILLAAAMSAGADAEPPAVPTVEVVLLLHPAATPPARTARAVTWIRRAARDLPGLDFMAVSFVVQAFGRAVVRCVQRARDYGWVR